MTTAWVFRMWVAVLAVFFAARMFVADPTAEGGVFGMDVALWLGGPSKLAAFVVASVFALRVAGVFEPDNAARRGWRALGFGFASFATGQAVLVVHQLLVPGPTPFPNVGDAAFLLGYVGLVVALIGLTRAFAASGLAIGMQARHVGLGAALAGAVGLVVLVLLLRGSVPTFAELAIGAAYPAFDCALLVPAAFLTRMTVALRQSQLAAPWIRLLIGLCALTVGDIVFAIATAFEIATLDPVLDLGFTVGYVFVAWGCQTQHALVRPP